MTRKRTGGLLAGEGRIQPPSSYDRIVAVLKRHPGTWFTNEELGGRLGLSRNAIREAIKKHGAETIQVKQAVGLGRAQSDRPGHAHEYAIVAQEAA